MIPFLFAFLSLAFGASLTHTVDFPVNKTAPVASIPSGQSIKWQVVYGYDEALPNIIVQSSWAPLKCMVANGILRAEFTSTRGTWPSSWPTTATCAANVGQDGSTITITLNVLSCTSAECERGDYDASATLPSCPSTWTIATGGYVTRGCALAQPAAGKVYAAPRTAKKSSALQTYPAMKQLGGSPNEADLPVSGVTCGIAWYETPAPDMWLLSVEVSDAVFSDLSGIYCPLRLYTTATKAYSWGTPINLVIDRP